MAINKPTKPSSTLPTTWGGIKTAFSQERIESGYEADVPEVVDGGNINYTNQGLFERLVYLTTIADMLNAMPVGKSLIIDSNNRFEYETFLKQADVGFNIHYME